MDALVKNSLLANAAKHIYKKAIFLKILFSFSIFCSAFLVFLIQPVIAKLLLPVYGGTPAVWTVCLLFFQALLLVSYGYAWVMSQWKTFWWRVVHLILVVGSIFYLPMHFIPGSLSSTPEFAILQNLIEQIGLPLLILGASAPLLQFAYINLKGNSHANPFYLYAASNAGSLIALLGYPWIIERFWTISQQFDLWSKLYGVYLFLLFLILLFPYQASSKTKALEKISIKQKTSWIFLSFLPCSLMMGVTSYISTDVAASPLFWVLPLALYLLSFVITFAKKPLISHQWITRNALFFLILPLIGFIYGSHQIIAWQLILVHLLSFFGIALLCHGELIRTRPEAEALTTFYLCIALGGLIAGVFNGLIAPRIFSGAYEYPLSLLLVLFIGVKSSRSLLSRLGILLFYVLILWLKSGNVLYQSRNFYGVKQVIEQAEAHILMSQTTVHGLQALGEIPKKGDISYYGPIDPIIKYMQQDSPQINALILGMGTGLMACQYRTEDSVNFVEIDEQMISLAKNPKLFTYLHYCLPHIQVIQQDGRLAANNAKDHAFQVVVLDAFNSDAVPVHLITLEALQIYTQKIIKNGVILVNISNRHLNLLPVLIAAGRSLNLIVLHKKDGGNPRKGQFPSEWVVLTENEKMAFHLMNKNGWRFVAEEGTILWTDDYSNIVPLLKW